MFKRTKSYIQKKIINKLASKLFGIVTEDDILRVGPDGRVYYKDKPLPKEQVYALKETATKFSETLLWQIIKDELTYQGGKKLYYKSTTEEDIIQGKMMLYIVDIIKSKVQHIKNIR